MNNTLIVDIMLYTVFLLHISYATTEETERISECDYVPENNF